MTNNATLSNPHPFPKVAGRCPACGGESLFLGSAGYVTCSRSECSDPGRVADLLHRPTHHVLELGETGWAIQHAVTCFPNLLDCPLHARIDAWMSTLTGPPAPAGRYIVGDNLKLTPIPAEASP